MTRSALIRARLAAAATILVAFGAVATFAEGAFLGNNPGNIDRDAISTRDGAVVQATGPLICSRDERVSLRLTVTQRATRAVGRAVEAACTESGAALARPRVRGRRHPLRGGPRKGLRPGPDARSGAHHRSPAVVPARDRLGTLLTGPGKILARGGVF